MTVLLVLIGVGAGVVLYELGGRTGAKLGFKLGVELSNEAINRFLAWLPADDRMVFKMKLREYNALQAANDKIADRSPK